MSEFFLTDPDNQSDDVDNRKTRPSIRGKSFDFKERVERELMALGVPFRAAEVACIDMRSEVIKGWHDRESPHATAERMFPRVAKLYKREDGSWHYETKKPVTGTERPATTETSIS